MRSTRVDLQLCTVDDLRREERRVDDRDDLIVVAMNDQRRHVEPFQVLGEIRLGEDLDAVVGCLEPDLHGHQPERVADALRHGRAGPVRTIERRAQVLVELRAVAGNTSADLVESLERSSARVRVGLQHQRRNRANQHGLRDARGSVPADVARDLTAAGRMADEDRVVQVELLDELPEIVGVGVHVVAGPRLARASVRVGRAPLRGSRLRRRSSAGRPRHRH